jgi:hypothetical protein
LLQFQNPIEEKDIKDICSILPSYELGEGKGCINIAGTGETLKNDKKYALTFRLNLESPRNENKKIGLPNNDIGSIMSKVDAILAGLPTVDKK